MNIHTGASLKPCNFFVSSSVTVLFYTFSATCTSCAVITVRLAKPFEVEVKSSEENMYICSVNSGQWHTEKTRSGDELIEIMWDDSWRIMWDGNELMGSTECIWVVVHGLAVAATSHAAHQHSPLFMLDYGSAGSLDFELLRVLLYFVLFEFSNQRIII